MSVTTEALEGQETQEAEGDASNEKQPAAQEEAGAEAASVFEAVAEKDSNLPEPEIASESGSSGITSISDQVIEAIVGTAALEIEGVTSVGTGSVLRTAFERLGGRERRARGVQAVAGRKEVILDIELKVAYGFSVPDIARQVRWLVYVRLLDLCGLVSKEINIRVSSVEFVRPRSVPSSRPGGSSLNSPD